MPALKALSGFFPSLESSSASSSASVSGQSIELSLNGEELVGIQILEESEIVGHHANAALQLDGARIEGPVEQPHRARRRIEQSGQTSNGGALAGAVRPEKPEEAAGRNRERQRFDGDDAAKLLAQRGNFDGVGHEGYRHVRPSTTESRRSRRRVKD
jgi:hypothetical protein